MEHLAAEEPEVSPHELAETERKLKGAAVPDPGSPAGPGGPDPGGSSRSSVDAGRGDKTQLENWFNTST